MFKWDKGEAIEYVKECLPITDIADLQRKFAKLCEERQNEYYEAPIWWLNQMLEEIKCRDESKLE